CIDIFHHDGTACSVDVVLSDGLAIGDQALPDGHEHPWIIEVAATCGNASATAVATPAFESHSGDANALHRVGEVHDGRAAADMRQDAWIAAAALDGEIFFRYHRQQAEQLDRAVLRVMVREKVDVDLVIGL